MLPQQHTNIYALLLCFDGNFKTCVSLLEFKHNGMSSIKKNLVLFSVMTIEKWGYAVAQLVEALRYKPEGRGFDSRWCHNPSGRTMALGLTQPLIEMSTRNISWGVKAAGA